MVAAERTDESDPSYGFRKLVDIAERSIAQPFTDPTTAVRRSTGCTTACASAPRLFPSGEHRDGDGAVRLIVRTPEWDGYVRLEDLKTVAPANAARRWTASSSCSPRRPPT